LTVAVDERGVSGEATVLLLFSDAIAVDNDVHARDLLGEKGGGAEINKRAFGDDFVKRLFLGRDGGNRQNCRLLLAVD
jgi:hypothetical protein